MCRYCACALTKSQLSQACSYKKSGQDIDVLWSCENNFVQYDPSNCMQPKEKNGLPVMIHGSHIDLPEESRIFSPMYWTLIPSSFDKDPSEWTTLSYNARVENLLESKIYSQALSEGKRCIVVMEGFYEVKKKSSSDEYYYMSHKKKPLLKAAGLFSTREIKGTNGDIYHTCSIITTEADKHTGKVHHRMPLILDDEQHIDAWLDYKNISYLDAISVLTQHRSMNLDYYQTSQPGSKKPLKSSDYGSRIAMSNWLSSGSRKRKLDQQ